MIHSILKKLSSIAILLSAVATVSVSAQNRTVKGIVTDAMAAAGIPVEFHSYQGLPHGFGLGTGTVAEGWIDDAVKFWEKNTH